MSRFAVVDRLTGERVYLGKMDPSYYDAHIRAEKWCAKHLGERGKIVECLNNGAPIKF